MKIKAKTVGLLGLSSVAILFLAIIVFGLSNKEFSFLHDYVSKLGAKGEPNAMWFNLIGFVIVGLLLSLFGFYYGKLLNDRLLSLLLSLFGLGFGITSISADLNVPNSPYSKAHIVAICLGLAFWLFGLSRLGSNQQIKIRIRKRANFTAVLLVLSIVGFTIELWSMPITHRLVFGIVFGWTALTSLELINHKSANPNSIEIN